MRLQALLLGVVMSSLFVATSNGQQGSTPRPHATAECKVTKPNGIAAGVEEPAPGSYGNSEVSAGPFGLWPDGTIVFKPVMPVSLLETGRSE